MLGFVSMAIISDDHFTTWFQSSVKHFKQSLLILDMQNGISAVDHIIKLIRVVHKSSIFNIELDSMFNVSLLLHSEVIGNIDHVDG